MRLTIAVAGPSLTQRLALGGRIFAAALWWGSLTTVCFLIAPLLFVYLPTPTLAGQLAAKLFTAQTWVSVACALVLLLGLRSKAASRDMTRSQSTMLFIALGMLLALVVEFAIAPRIVARVNHRVWHSVGVLLCSLQWCCAALVLWKTALRSETAA